MKYSNNIKTSFSHLAKALIILAIQFVFFNTGWSQNKEFAQLDSFFNKLEQHDRFFGSVAVSRAGEIIYSKAIGLADIEAGIKNKNETKFRIGSITKTFTSTLVMKAVEMNKLNLDDHIDLYFPDIENADQITVKHLLNHRSGINTFTDREYFSWYTQPITKSDLLQKIKDKGIGFEPNAKYSYSNSNYVLLTFILEEVFHNDYGQILKNHIVQPFGLANTSYGGKITVADNEARSYRMKADWELEPEGDMSIPLGAGGIISTPTDLCLFAEALFGGKIISSKNLGLMKPQEDDSNGFALEYQNFEDMKGIGHGGDIDAFTSTLAYFEKDDLCFALTCNGSNYGKHDIAIAVLQSVYGKSIEVPSFEFIELSSSDLDLYLGTYVTDELPMEFMISKDGDQLLLQIPGQSPSVLTAEGNHNFSVMKYGVKIVFIPSERKMLFSQQGMDFELKLKSSTESPKVIEINLDPYLGTYTLDDLPMDLVFSKKGNTLIAQGTGQPSFELKSEGNHQFSNSAIGLNITFHPERKNMQFVQGHATFVMSLKE